MQLIRNVFILSIVSFLVMGSVGIDVFKHICKEDGITVTLFVEAEHHCKEEVQTSCCSGHDEKDCCDDEVQHVQIQPDYYNDFFSPEWIALITPQSLHYNVYEDVVSEEVSISNYPQPPPLTGRQLLTKNQVWVI